ncbi:glycosyltransferase [Plantibacter flavus]|uniref:glycosyltransferase n=1 Tax=Plantibacter flavus TaxID=150123 RepID=UPI00339B58F1
MTPTHRKPTVTIVVSHLVPVLGIERAALDLAAELVTHADVTFVCLGDDAPRAERLWADVSVLGTPLRGRQRLASLWRARRLRGLSTDAVVLAGPWAAIPSLAALGRKPGMRVIVWEHSFDSEKLASSRSLRLLRTAARRLYGRADAVVAVSSSLARDLDGWLHLPVVTVIPNIVALPASGERESVPAAAEQPEPISQLVSIGSLTTTKNHQLAIRALLHLPEDVSLDILGDGPLRASLEALIVELGLKGRVHLRGYVQDAVSDMTPGTILVHPALGETFGLVLFEAASRHCPVVVLDRSAMRDAVPTFVPGARTEDDPAAFAAAITAVAAAPPSADEFAAADELRRLHYDSSRITSAWSDMLLGSSHHRRPEA